MHGIAAWWLHHERALFGIGWPANAKVFATVLVVLVAVAGALIWLVPLSFDMPINLQLCDGPAPIPDYCP